MFRGSDITTYAPGTGTTELIFKLGMTISRDPLPPPSLSPGSKSLHDSCCVATVCRYIDTAIFMVGLL